MSDVVQSLWIGPRLSAMERLPLGSFAPNGDEVHLYTYGKVDVMPDGITGRDGNEILPESRVFQYRDFPSYAGFSNYFRYRLLLLRCGWWIDADAVCLRPLSDLDVDYVFAAEEHEGRSYINSGVIKAPAGSDAMQWAWRSCDARDPATIRWGETGPRLVGEAVARFGLDRFVQPAAAVCPLGYARSEGRRI